MILEYDILYKNKEIQVTNLVYEEAIRMKTVRLKLFSALLTLLSFTLTACSSVASSPAIDTTGLSAASLPDVEIIVFEQQALTFDELILRSDAAVVGEYIETIRHNNYIEQKFKVKECLYGDVTDSEIYLYSNVGTSHVPDVCYTYELGADVYGTGTDYILVTERFQSVLCDHDRYMLNADVLLCEGTKEFTMYSQPLDIPDETNIKDYIRSVYSSVPHPAAAVPVSYENETAEMLGESAYIGTVNILELVNEGKVHNGNVYRCSVESLSKGEDLNTYDDGTVLIVILKNTVEVGGSYIVGFSPASEHSLIYHQATATSVYPVSDELLSEISNIN